MALYFSKNGGSTAIEGEEVGEIAYLLNPDQTKCTWSKYVIHAQKNYYLYELKIENVHKELQKPQNI